MNNKERLTYVFNFVKLLKDNNKAVWRDEYGNTYVIIGRDLLSELIQEWKRCSQNYVVVASPIIKDKINIPSNCLFKKGVVEDVSKILSIGGAKEHNVAKEFLFKNNKNKFIELITVPIPLSNDSFCTNRFSPRYGNIVTPSLGSTYPSKIIIDLDILNEIESNGNMGGIGEVVGLYYSIWDYYSVRKLSPPMEIITNIEYDIRKLITEVKNSEKKWLKLLSLELIKKCFIMRVFKDHQIGASGDHLIAYGIEYYLKNMNKFSDNFSHGKLVYLGSIVMAALFPEWEYRFFSLKNLIDVGINLKLINYEDLDLLVYMMKKGMIIDFAIKTRPKRPTSLSAISQTGIRGSIVRLEECVKSIKEEECDEP